MHAYNTKLATAMLGRQAKLPTKQPSLGHNAWYSVNPRQSRNRTALNQKKKSPPAIQYPEMVAADYDPSEPVRSLTPIVQELTKIKKRVNEVRLPWQQSSITCTRDSWTIYQVLTLMHTLLNLHIVVFMA